jgi:hypothetical protein
MSSLILTAEGLGSNVKPGGQLNEGRERQQTMPCSATASSGRENSQLSSKNLLIESAFRDDAAPAGATLAKTWSGYCGLYGSPADLGVESV